ncbi:hypothetical protein RSOL_192170, partial [Rhizoctonia solani AG-3 Rhs1AP]
MSDIDETTLEIDYDYPEDKNFDVEWDLEPPRNPKPEATALHQKQYEAVSTIVKCMNKYELRLDTLYTGVHSQAALKTLEEWAWNHAARPSCAEPDRLGANKHGE